jgi:hypothetical protein
MDENVQFQMGVFICSFFFFIHISPLLSPFWHCKEVCSIGIGSGGKMANASVMLDVGFDSIKCSF